MEMVSNESNPTQISNIFLKKIVEYSSSMATDIMDQHETGKYVIGVDVGTASVRCGLFALDGKLVRKFVQPISVLRDDTDSNIYEQSSDEIWHVVCTVVQVHVHWLTIS